MNIGIRDNDPVGAVSFYRSLGVLSNIHRLDNSIKVTVPHQINWASLCGLDILYVERPQFKEDVQSIEMAKNFGLKVVIDYDDLLPAVPEWNPYYEFFHKSKVMDQMQEALKLADAVIVSTPAIKQFCDQYNDSVVVIPNAINDYQFKFQHYNLESTKDVLVAWRGSVTHRRDLLNVKEDILYVDSAIKNLHWLFLGNEVWYITDYLKKKYFQIKEHDIIDYHNLITKANLSALMVPLEDIPFNRAKSNISFLEATLAGCPCIAPNFPEFSIPGCINYDNSKRDHFGYILEKTCKSAKFRKENYDQAYEWVKENRLLSQTNVSRLHVFNEVMKK